MVYWSQSRMPLTYMHIDTSPNLLSATNNYQIMEAKPFIIHVSESFYPQDNSLHYYLKSPAPPWLLIDNSQGILHGTAPKVEYNKVFKINMTAGNDWGLVTKSFILTVICTDVVYSMPPSLVNILNLDKQNYGLKHIKILEYMYVLYEQPENQAKLQNFLQKAATEKNIKLENKSKPNYEDFEKVMLSIDPAIEKYLQENLSKDAKLSIEHLNLDQFCNLVRMGSQPQGSHAIPVWNHAGYPDLSNWPEILAVYSNVLEAASDDVVREHEKNMHIPKNTPYKKN